MSKSKQQLIDELRQRIAALEEASQEKESEAVLLLQAAPLGIHECDTNGRITFVNPCQERITGYTADELVGTHIWDRMEPGPQKESLPVYLKRLVLEQPCPTPFVAKNVRKNGELYDIRVDWNYNRNPQGQVTGFLCFIADVTEQKRIEAALQESEERYRRLAESTTDMVFITDRAGDVLYANPSAAAAMRSDVNSIVGKRQEELFPPEIARRHTESITKVFETGEVFDTDGVYRFGPTEMWLNTRLMPLRDEKGAVTSVMGVSRDVTDRKRAEEALRKAHDQLEQKVQERTAELTKANEELTIFRRFAEASGEGFGMSEFDGRIAYVNSTLCRWFGETTPQDVIGKSVFAYYQKEYVQRRQDELIPTLLREGHWHIEQTVLPRRGEPIQTLQSTFLIRDESGNPFRIAVVISDITERKAAQEALQQSCDQLQTIYDGIIEGLLITDIKTKRFVRVNSSLCRMLGYSQEELLAASLKDIHPPEEAPNDLQRFQAVAEGRVSINEGRPVLRKDGGIFYADITGHKIVYEGRPCVLAFFHDVTERKRAEEALRQQHRTLKHLLESSDHERQLIAYEIHDELAQQLAGAMMQFETYAHLKETKPKEAAKAYDAGMTMLRQGHFETRRLISGVRPPILDEEGVVAAVAHLVNEQNRLKGPKIEYRSRVGFDRLAPILENAIYRIAQEGLANACQHSKSAKARVSLSQREDHVRIEVRDWGIGFNPREAKENRFGLEGIRQRVRLLRGKCSVRSTLGKGTRITVELPVIVRE